jgi:hypothetical protein
MRGGRRGSQANATALEGLAGGQLAQVRVQRDGGCRGERPGGSLLAGRLRRIDRITVGAATAAHTACLATSGASTRPGGTRSPRAHEDDRQASRRKHSHASDSCHRCATRMIGNNLLVYALQHRSTSSPAEIHGGAGQGREPQNLPSRTRAAAMRRPSARRTRLHFGAIGAGNSSRPAAHKTPRRIHS